MVKFGCCLPIASFVPQEQGGNEESIDFLQRLMDGMNILEKNGYDFVELTVGSLVNLPQDVYDKVKELIEASSIKVPAFNSFIPKTIPLTGPMVSQEAIEEYLDIALARVHGVGGRYVVFGSGGARQVPDGFPVNSALDQLSEFLHLCNKYAEKNDIIITIEHLNKGETNIINSVDEAIALASRVDLPHIKVLADSYHMNTEKESFDILYKAAPWLAHVHIAEKDRHYPGQEVPGGVDFKSLFGILKEIGYKGGISTECPFPDLEKDTKISIDYIKNIWSSLG